ncbi:unnamed protein product [Closterium sp. NIES-53]
MRGQRALIPVSSIVRDYSELRVRLAHPYAAPHPSASYRCMPVPASATPTLLPPFAQPHSPSPTLLPPCCVAEFPYTPEPAASRGSDTFSSTAGGGGSSLPPPPVGIWGVFTVAFYRPFFDVDTADVVERVRDALMPFPRSSFLEKTALNPDIYGPFWICTTLVFLSASLGNLASYLSYAASPSSGSEEHWHYNIDAVSWAAAIFYGYVAVVPLLLFFLLRYLQVLSACHLLQVPALLLCAICNI